jgi:hypothetical protein
MKDPNYKAIEIGNKALENLNEYNKPAFSTPTVVPV